MIPGNLRPLLQLTLAPGLGPVLIARLLDAFGSAQAVLGLSASQLSRVRGLGASRNSSAATTPTKADDIARGLASSATAVDRELELAERLRVTFAIKGEPGYPPLLAEIPSAPPLLYLRGRLDPAADRYPLAIVGSRRCTAYGTEQAARFASVLASSGLTIVSGGAKGVDAAGHRGALKSGGRTIVVQGCGLAGSYPPDHAPLYDQIVDTDAGAIISELPLSTPPAKENFPARNRIISGMSLGVLVIEAADHSGSLITARIALEDHNREVFALPGRVDSASSKGSLELLKKGEAALVTDPGDVLQALETPARHHHAGTHASRYQPDPEPDLFSAEPAVPAAQPPALRLAPISASTPPLPASPRQTQILTELDADDLTFDQLQHRTSLDPGDLRAELTMLEIQRRISRDGPRFRKRP